MKTIRQITQKNDPMARIQLPEELILKLKDTAKQNKRRPQDQFIKSLAETFKHEANYLSTFNNLLPDLKAVYSKK